MRSRSSLLAVTALLAASALGAAAQGTVAGTVRAGRGVVADVVLSLTPVTPRELSPATDTALIDQVHLVTASRRRILNVVEQVSRIVNLALGCGVDFDQIDKSSFVNFLTGAAFSTRLC